MKGKEGNPLVSWCFSFSSSVFLSCRSRRRKKAASQASSMNGIRSRRRPAEHRRCRTIASGDTGAFGKAGNHKPGTGRTVLAEAGERMQRFVGIDESGGVGSSPLYWCNIGYRAALRADGGMKQTIRDTGSTPVFQVVCLLAACAALLVPLSSCIQAVCRAAESTSIFMGSFVPVYAGILFDIRSGGYRCFLPDSSIVCRRAYYAAGHSCPGAGAYGIVGLGIGGILGYRLASGFLGAAINKGAAWLLGITTALFVGMLTLPGDCRRRCGFPVQQGSAFLLSSMVPVVGGSLSEALGAVKSCLGLLKSTVGGFGMATRR